MKKVILALCTICLLSCNKDDENTNSITMPTLVGKWQQQKTVVISGKDNTTILLEKMSSDCDKRGYLEFLTDTFGTLDFFINIKGECTQDGNIEYLPYSYDAANKKITFIKQAADVIKHTETEFACVIDSADQNNDGINDKWIAYYKKI